MICENLLPAQQATIWCGFWADGVFGSFFENESGYEIALNGECYHNIIMKFLWHQWTVLFWKTCDSSRTVQLVTLHTKLSCKYMRRSLKILLEEGECASRVAEYICLI